MQNRTSTEPVSVFSDIFVVNLLAEGERLSGEAQDGRIPLLLCRRREGGNKHHREDLKWVQMAYHVLSCLESISVGNILRLKMQADTAVVFESLEELVIYNIPA